ncbi:MAG: division/cell wall cluster transcriptional repressor MraZ [Dehalococcoidia bacterium]|nr:division/cell wall cluster transcriptional repressor MraZ [Dehalococcoidia bacterium]
MFRGTWDYSVDDRGRIPIPPRYRPLFEKGGVLVDGSEGCLELYTEQDYAERSVEIQQIADTTADGRRIHRYFYGTAREVELDRQGRILVPQNLRDAAAIDGGVVVMGRGRVLELWNRERWERENEVVREQYSPALERRSQGQPG